MSRVQLVDLGALSEEQKQALACTEAEQQLAGILAELVFAPAQEGNVPAVVYLELAAIILARTAHDAIAHQNRAATTPIDPRRSEAALLSYALDRASELIAERPA